MSTVQEIKAAAGQLPPEQRLELSRWLVEMDDVRALRRAELCRELGVGLDQAERGELVDRHAVFERLRQRYRA